MGDPLHSFSLGGMAHRSTLVYIPHWKKYGEEAEAKLVNKHFESRQLSVSEAVHGVLTEGYKEMSSIFADP